VKAKLAKIRARIFQISLSEGAKRAVENMGVLDYLHNQGLSGKK
jgi:hypothetical protein